MMPIGRSGTRAEWLAENPLFSQKDIRHESLRIAVDYREPAALNLHHNPVSFLKGVIVGRKRNLVVLHRVRRNRLGFFKAFPVTTPENIARDHRLIAAHFGSAWYFCG